MEGTNMAHEILTLKSVHQTEKYGYSHVAKNGNTLYISGQLARDHGVDCVGRGDIEAQTRQVLTNLQNILEEVGGSLRNVAKLTTILTHHSYRETFRKVRPEFFQDPAPANTLIVVESLASPDFLIEIEAIAVLDWSHWLNTERKIWHLPQSDHGLRQICLILLPLNSNLT